MPATLELTVCRLPDCFLGADARLTSDSSVAGAILADLTACTYAATSTLHLRLRLPADDSALHAVRWEMLREPETRQPVMLFERVCFVRTLDSADFTPVACKDIA
jgi:hypothetical protein